MPKENVDFWIGFKDENLRQFSAYVIGPEDSVYRHKLVKLKFDVPEQYPLVPPKVNQNLKDLSNIGLADSLLIKSVSLYR